ncbi:DEAD-box ATP-dependent RNA helicase 14, partial [Hyalella azteca]|uniref:DEAD-box ATP-dependent RNA helicase 14 n=1 Tax=Hyalella azteca TaxID=294128 RepID=A0A979FP04_HYAAZ
LEDLLREMLEGKADAQAMVFCETKRMVDNVSFSLERKGFKVRSIHGDKTQKMRDSVLNGFRRGHVSVLVATDVAARGIDIPDLTCVVNYDFPDENLTNYPKYIPDLTCVVNYDFPAEGVESYVHRIGRTGRRGNKGYAHAFFTADDAGHARQLIKLNTPC